MNENRNLWRLKLFGLETIPCGDCELPEGTIVRAFTRRCRKTNITDEQAKAMKDLPERYGDKGFFTQIEVIGGMFDGLKGDILDDGNFLEPV